LFNNSLAKAIKLKKNPPNNVLYPEISKQFLKVAESSQKSSAYETGKHTFKLCRLLLKQRYTYWQNNSKDAPLYVKLHDESQVPLPSTKLHTVEFIEGLHVAGLAGGTYSKHYFNLKPIQLQQPDCIDPNPRYRTPVKLLPQVPYHIQLCSELLSQPTRLLRVLLHEVTHLEQLNNALALDLYLKQKYGIKLKRFYPFFPAHTSTFSNQAYTAMENDTLLQSLRASLLSNLKSNSYDKKALLCRIAKALSPHALSSHLEAEADSSSYQFMHNPFLMNNFFAKQPFFYEPESVLQGYDPDRTGSINQYARNYYRKFPEHIIEHIKEYSRLKPFLTKE
jgi:hypothetical protein